MPSARGDDNEWADQATQLMRPPRRDTVADRSGAHTVPGFVAVTRAVVRGLNIRACTAWVQAVHGDAGVRALVEALPADAAKELGPALRPAMLSWVSFRSHVAQLTTVDRLFGDGDLELLRSVGTFMAFHDFPALSRPLARILSPTAFVTMGTKLWRFYNAHGTWNVARGERSFVGALVERPEVHPASCMTLMGWIVGALTFSGAKDAVVVEEKCACRGDALCSFRSSWR